MKKAIIMHLSVITAIAAFAQDDKAGDNGFLKTQGGLEYKIIQDVAGEQVKPGGYVGIHLNIAVSNTSVGDSIFYTGRKANANKPLEYLVPKTDLKGDLPEGLALLSPGDSAIFRQPVESTPGYNKAYWYRPGTDQKFIYYVRLAWTRSHEEMKVFQKEETEKQKQADEKILSNYFTKYRIEPSKTASGLYYKIDVQGKGETAKPGQKVTVNYTGTFPSGKAFDSNTEPQFGHVSPYTFVLGRGNVIKAWDEGIALLKKNSKARFFIPSALAYGRQGNAIVGPDKVLIYQIEIVDIK